MTGHIIYAAALAKFAGQPIPPLEISEKARNGRRRDLWLRRFQLRRPPRPAIA
jgi:hypothetical protein